LQKHMMHLSKTDTQRYFLKNRKEDDSWREYTRLTDGMQGVINILKTIPPELAENKSPEGVLQFLINVGLLSESVFPAYGGRADIIKAINFFINNNTYRRPEGDKS